MGIVYLFCGLAAAGKTTLAQKLEKETGATRFTLDQRMIDKYPYSIFDEEYGQLVGSEKLAIWQEAQAVLQDGGDVILDWSLWSRERRTEWTQRVLSAGYTYKLFYLKISRDELRLRLAERNAHRSEGVHVVPIAELERFSHIFESPTADEGLNLEIITPDTSHLTPDT